MHTYQEDCQKLVRHQLCRIRMWCLTLISSGLVPISSSQTNKLERKRDKERLNNSKQNQELHGLSLNNTKVYQQSCLKLYRYDLWIDSLPLPLKLFVSVFCDTCIPRSLLLSLHICWHILALRKLENSAFGTILMFRQMHPRYLWSLNLSKLLLQMLSY